MSVLWTVCSPKKGVSIGGARGRNYAKAVAALALLVVAAGAVWGLYGDGLLSPALFIHLFANHPVTAPLLYVGAFAICVLTLVPTLPLSLLAGTLWGPLLGGLISALSTFLGTMGAFYAARLLFGQPLARRFNSRHIARLQQEFDRKGWKFVAFIRLNLLLPTGLLNYLLGLTSIKAFTYIWVTLLFLLPQDFATALIGHKIGRAVMTVGGANTIDIVLGVSAVVVMPLIIWYATQTLNVIRKKAFPIRTSTERVKGTMVPGETLAMAGMPRVEPQPLT